MKNKFKYLNMVYLYQLNKNVSIDTKEVGRHGERPIKLKPIKKLHLKMKMANKTITPVSLDTDGVLRISAGYRWKKSGIYRNNKKTLFASLVHHALYHLIGENELVEGQDINMSIPAFQRHADKVFYGLCIINKMERQDAENLLREVRKLGNQATGYDPNSSKEVYEAPANIEYD